MLHYWPVNLRVVRKFTGLPPPPPPPPPPQKKKKKKTTLDLSVARQSTTSPLPDNWVFTANLGTPNGAGNVILQQLACVCFIGWELNHDFYAYLLKISFHVQNVFTIFL